MAQQDIGTETLASAFPKVQANFDELYTEAYGSFYITTGLTNTANGTPAKLVGSGVTAENISSGFTHATPNKLTYTGTATKVFKITADLTCTHTAQNAILTFSIAKNGTNITNSSIQRKVGTGGDIGALSMSWAVSLATNDYLEVYADSTEAGTTTVSLGSITVVKIN